MLLAVMAVMIVILVAVMGAIVALESITRRGDDVSQTLHLPDWVDAIVERDTLAFPGHVVLARAFRLLRLSPTAEGLQWLKAAAHQQSDEQVRSIGAGLRSALDRAETAEQPRAAAAFCSAARRGGRPGHSMSVAFANLRCDMELEVYGHVPEGRPIYYELNPPRGGPHYPTPYPRYGVVDEAVVPGYWIHNLEHGAVVVLYRCDIPCPDLVRNLRNLHASLPVDRNSPSGRARLLIVPDSGLPSAMAIAGWGTVLLLDGFDPEVMRAFYAKHVDRGPECRRLRCPE